MIITVDIETYEKKKDKLEPVLDATKFYCGAITRESMKTKVYYNKSEMWNKILDIGRAEAKRGKMLNVYAHYHTYDFHGYADLTDKNITWFSERPFIVSYSQNKKEIIKFLDTYAIYRMSLKKVGDLVGLKKLEMPEGVRLNHENNSMIEKYLERDSQIVMKAIKYIDRKLKEQGVNIRRLYTINQIAIQYLINKLKEHKKSDHVFYNRERGQLIRPRFREKIHKAYRGGRVECFKTGKIEGVTYIDCNSLYPYSATKIRFPDLRTERRIWRPLEHYKEEELLEKIGISRVLMRNKENKIGLIPVRTTTANYYPTEGKLIIGTYTNQEIREAKKHGYEIIQIEWSILYEEAHNPFKEIVPEIYNLRMKSKDEFNNYFYKMMMNASYGKLAQTRTGQIIRIDSVEEAKKYISRNYKIIGRMEYNMIYRKSRENPPMKKYYAPIIPTLINAQARVYMHEQFQKIGKDDMVYTDTDSILFIGEHEKKFKISDRLGDFKKEYGNKEAIIYSRKTYSIGEQMKIAGITQRKTTIEQFKRGIIENRKMISFKQQGMAKAGTFTTEKRDLRSQREEYEEAKELLDSQEIYIDSDIQNINYLIEALRKQIKPSG